MERYNIPKSIYSSLDRTERQNECFGKTNIQKIDDWYCDIGSNAGQIDFMVFGDSHALSFLPAVDAVANEMNMHGVFVGTSGCTPFLGVHALRSDQSTNNCYQLNKRVYEFVKNNGIKNLYLVARWTYYTDGGYNGDSFSYISKEENGKISKSNSREAFEYGLEITLEEYNQIGTSLYFVSQVPQQLFNPLDLYVLSDKNNKSIHEVSINIEDHKRLQSYVSYLFDKNNVNIVSLDHAFCEKNNCSVGNDEVSYYYDDDHLSLSGSEKIKIIVKDSLNSIE